MKIKQAKKFKDGQIGKHVGIKIVRKDPFTLVLYSKEEPEQFLGIIHSDVFEIGEAFVNALINELYGFRAGDNMMWQRRELMEEFEERM